jgi:hypothetical protein
MIRPDARPNGTQTASVTSNVEVAGRWNMLLYWMSNMGEGSWDRFRSVVTQLAGGDGDLSQLRRSLRVRLSDFSHADFFIGDSSRWNTLPPLVAGLVEPTGAALLIGARTPRLVSDVQACAARTGVVVRYEASDDSPAVIRLEGPADALSACAVASGIAYADNYAWRLAGALSAIPSLLERPRRDTDQAPINWTPRSYDLHSRAWVDGSLPNAACEFTPRYGRPRYFISNRRRRLLEVASRRDVVYAAAYSRGVSLAAYDPTTRTLSVPLSAPLPEAFARVACLCSGRRADVRQGRIAYEGVPREIVAVLLTALGQPAAIVANARGAQEG